MKIFSLPNFRCYRLLSSLVLGSLILPVAAKDEKESEGPNLVLIMADDLGWRDLRCYGNEKLDTPVLDQLAKEGMLFTDAYAAAPVCSPTRAAIMTGQAPARLKITNHAPGNAEGFSKEGSDLVEPETVRYLPLSYLTLAERLKQAGYETAHIGKWHLSHVPRGQKDGPQETDLRPEHQGFSLNVGGCDQGGPPSYFAPYRIRALKAKKEGEYLPERLAEEAIAFIQEKREKPFFLHWCPYSVHYPMEAREELIAKYEERKGPGLPNPTYGAMIEAMDTQIGRFLEALDEMGLRENTLVIFKSDNGGYDGDNRPLKGVKGMLYEGGIRIPWIARWPGKIAAGTTCATPVISMDCFPTLLEAAGVEASSVKPCDGENLLPLLMQQEGFSRDAIYFHYPNYAFHRRNDLGGVVREGPYKLIKRYEEGDLELYHLGEDIGESRNLSEESPEVAKRLEEKLDSWLKDVGAAMPTRQIGE